MEMRQPASQATGKMSRSFKLKRAPRMARMATPPITTAVLKRIPEAYLHLSAIRQMNRQQQQQRTNQMKGAATQLKILTAPVRNPRIRAR